MNKQTVKLGLIGLGQMGRNHLRVLSMLRGVDIAFIFDANFAHAQQLATQYGLQAVEDIQQAAAQVDAVVICTPTITHADYIQQLAPVVKNIFVEKPLAHSLAAADALAPLIKQFGTQIQVGFIERFNPAVAGLHRVLQDANRVINIDFTRTNRLSSRITDVDVISDLMIHDIDLALYLNGEVETVSAQGVVHDGLIEFASAQITHKNGCFSRLQASRITEKKIRLIQATCDDRFVDCDLLRKEIQIHRQSVVQQNSAEAYSISSQQETVAIGQQEALLSELQAFVSLARGDAVNIPDYAAGIESLRVCEAIREAILRAAT